MQGTVISFVAKGTNSGKTYLIEKLIGEFKARGKRVTAVKHGTHRMEVDKKGKDTYKFAQQGADRIILFSDSAMMLYELTSPHVERLVSLATEGVDIVLVEGFKSGPFRKIEVFNPDLYDSPLCLEESGEEYIAIVSREYLDVGLPWFSFEDLHGICDFIEGLSDPGLPQGR
ncbi:MAG TPA: molybdopterin-guanine dinucleotide biosynthesis protein B [Deltaproteobacteria bacterium]|jgi:molybdopterin-guanine dinucleotide biosynthesis protein B|nr:molybdopterin-guanine dinucleotide biosynthesis protein B [Deltaproteobacteria bacterium]HOI08020.1 molybdopterin-guanine dinucleotide biosynthesis protein B [Deltaproteobacteria bacterium]